MPPGKLEVLFVDDSVDDQEFFSRAISQARAPITLSSMNDGEQGLNYLRQLAPYTGVKKPDLVVLDINLPKKNGIEVLEVMKGDPALRPIPVVMLSTSDSPDGIGESYCRGASCYLVKPDDVQGWNSLIDALAKYWTRAALAQSHVCT